MSKTNKTNETKKNRIPKTLIVGVILIAVLTFFKNLLLPFNPVGYWFIVAAVVLVTIAGAVRWLFPDGINRNAKPVERFYRFFKSIKNDRLVIFVLDKESGEEIGEYASVEEAEKGWILKPADKDGNFGDAFVRPIDPSVEDKCPNCGSVLSSDAKFCCACGTKVEKKPKPAAEERKCSKCGAVLNPGAKFCHECGEPYVEVKPVEPLKYFCPTCGREFADGERFCSECGTSREKAVNEEPSAPAADASEEASA